MKGILQFCDTQDGFYRSVSADNTNIGSVHEIRYIWGRDRVNTWTRIGYHNKIIFKTREINAELLSRTEWYFRIYYPQTNEYAALGLQKYIIQFDGMIAANSQKHTIILEFEKSVNDYDTITTPGGIPPNSAIYIDAQPIYVP